MMKYTSLKYISLIVKKNKIDDLFAENKTLIRRI